jgi:hypothetical protein
MLTTNSAFRDASASGLAIQKCEMIFGRATIRVCADDHRKQAVMLDDVSSLECAHRV